MTVSNCTVSTLWVACGVFTVSALIFLFKERSHVKAKQYNFVTALMNFVAAAAYFLMALQPDPTTPEAFFGVVVGSAPDGQGSFRDLYWLRYLSWAATTPLILLDMGMLAGFDFWENFLLIVLDILMIACGYVGAAEDALEFKAFAPGMVLFVIVMFRLANGVQLAAQTDDSDDKAAKMGLLLGITVVTWACYPLFYLLCQQNLISECAEVISFAVLDVVSKAVFGFVLLRDEDMLVDSTEIPQVVG
uniref:Rhodopsin-like 3 n=1 Tax=Oxyrrhis marina TaxID=2969 RepID=A0A0B4P501_OXYMA|nr:rhodopsin-like 3 [Oxyrrhis marina]